MTVSMQKARKTSPGTASTTTASFTTHVVHVDLAAILGQFDVTDSVVLMVATPSGREKRIAIGGNFLVDTRPDARVWQ